MQLENSFTVPVPIDEAWRVLLDIERIAPCMPGAALDSVEGDDFTGRVKVKLGPINLTYQGKASFVEKDEAVHRAVIDAKGKDQRGNGTAAATITANLKPEGAATRVDVLTDLNITGRPAQFGRGVMTDVGNKLLGQFADKLAAQLGAGEAPAPQPSPATTAGKAAATAAGAVEEAAAAAEQVPGEGAAAQKTRKAATATKKTAAAAADKAASTVEATAAQPTAQPAPTEAAAPGATAPAAVAPSITAPTATAPSVATPVAPVTAAPAAPRPQAVVEPEPIDLLEVAGGAAFARYAQPAAGIAVLLLLITWIIRRRRS
ncbi:SRPBCC family protein [Geodermatophilus ruber]|uniref:Carbon monoxide dehydrogenase subunit G n=1 Tax=Geodermatophilus ruber TaxID=504800 RepID=A0A1I3ZDN3_9ACTN|nr:SRPBCC family protein [Geodermatophilus ruber]SFK42298.1 Carbon monoxide dehydrogenase subunit G [Geodermatophilus ruber]